MPEKLPRFVELVRVSSQGQADRDTPEDQRRALDRLRASRPGVFVERIEAAESGALDGTSRVTIVRLLELAANRAFDEVRVRHLDRLTRHPDIRERAAIYGALADAHAIIVDAGGHVIDPSSEVGEIDYSLQTWMASRERKRIAERTRGAKDRLAGMGRLVSSWPPVGRTFDKKSGEWGTEPEGLERGRRIFALFLEPGATLWSVARRLNAEGVPTPSRRGEWHHANLRQFLTKPTAIGIYTTHGHTFPIPPLVDKATFDAVAEKLKANRWKMSGRPAQIDVLLRKLLVCGVCGCTLYADRGGPRNSYVYYLCSGGDPECRRYHRADALDAMVQERVRAFLERPDLLEAGASHEPAKGSSAEDEIAAAESELKDLDRQEDKIARLARRELLTARAMTAQLREIAALRKAAERTLSDAQARKLAEARADDERAEIADRLASLRKRLGKAPRDEWRAVLGILFPRDQGCWIRVYPDGSVEYRGALPLDDAGASMVKRRALPLRAQGTVPKLARKR